MKIALMSGAYLNAGDYLIVKRCVQLLKYVYPDCEIEMFLRKDELLKEKLLRINRCDVMLLAGGPLYLWNMYPDIMPLSEDLEEIKIPIFAMACGQQLEDNAPHSIYNHSFSERTKQLLTRIEGDGFQLGCRDYYAYQLLNGMGYNAIVTGCAAWYDLSNNKFGMREQFEKPIERIYVSDCARLRNSNRSIVSIKNNTNNMIDVIETIKRKYPKATVQVIFHSDITCSHNAFLKYLNEIKISYKVIGGDVDAFNLYDKCDLHIGFRVHAHIYCMSHHIRSILIGEDARGCGVNQTLGLADIKCFDSRDFLCDKKLFEKITKKVERRNKYIGNEVLSCIEYYESNNWQSFNWAYEKMDYYFRNMIEHIKSLKALA